MSLKQLINTPEIKTAFSGCAIATRTPDLLRDAELLVPSAGGPRGLAGTAFDHLARTQIVRDFASSIISLHDEKNVLDQVEFRLDLWQLPYDYEQYLRQSIKAAKDEMTLYAAGRGDLHRLAHHIQDVAWAVNAFRGGVAPDPKFRPTPAISEELTRMLELFDPKQIFSPREVCLLNPVFVASPWVGGADADLVIDSTLIDLKTNVSPYVDGEMMRQLAGYAVLQSIGGIKLGNAIHDTPFQTVGLYFARHGELVTWTIEDIFPGDGFARFRSTIEEIIAPSRKQCEEREERLQRILQRQADETAPKKPTRAKKRQATKKKAKKRAR